VVVDKKRQYFPDHLEMESVRQSEPLLIEYISEIRISPAVEAKIRLKHNITGADVRGAFVYRNDIEAAWVLTPNYGQRLEVKGKIYDGRTILAYLFEVSYEFGIWNLGTAWILRKEAN